MVIENALFFKIASKLGIQQIYLYFWRKHLVRNLLNSRRRVMLQRLKKSIFARSDYPLASRIAEDLKNYGIAKCDVSELQDAPSIAMLQKEYDDLLSQDDKNPHNRKSKSYIQRLVDDDYSLSKHDSAISRYLLNETVALACTLYLGLIPKLTSFKIWRSHQVEQSQREASQNWHRDYNEYQMVRVFLYFNDVSSNNGAGDYVSGSHFLGDGYNKLLDSNGDLSRYSTDSQVLTEFSADRIITADGKAGTLYFVDTGGLHRGGYHPVPGERRVSLTTFSTSADLMPTRIRKPKNLKVKNGYFRRILV